MVSGFGGRYSVRKGGYKKRWWATVSSSMDRGCTLWLLLCLLRCDLRGTCWDLCRKMDTWCSLLRVLMFVFRVPAVICVNFLPIHSFNPLFCFVCSWKLCCFAHGAQEWCKEFGPWPPLGGQRPGRLAASWHLIPGINSASQAVVNNQHADIAIKRASPTNLRSPMTLELCLHCCFVFWWCLYVHNEKS